ncbi:type II toxin-antitoxin system HicA family toxin [Thiohalocapsa halophila]|uniref:type II toxin-antitoxin system HicA family toxin n=1 Tax=Thiohalocapsa halophila TaxID=69359 RepID=UPI003F69378D
MSPGEKRFERWNVSDFVVARERGSHIVMRRGSSGCVVPDHRELKLGTLSGFLK